MAHKVRKKGGIVRFVLLITLTLGIFWLSLTSSPPDFDETVLGWDKAQHALAYGVLAFVAGRLFSMGWLTAIKAWGFAFLYAIVVGGILEVLQAIAGTGRTCEWGDLVADATGALAASIIGMCLHRWEKR